MHALELLLDYHEYVTRLFDRFRIEDDGISLFSQIRSALELHRHLEEAFFYPKLSGSGSAQLDDAIRSAAADHRQIKADMDELDGVPRGDEGFVPKLKVIMEDVQHYVEQEEEKMFPLVEQLFDESELLRIGSEMAAEKTRLQHVAGNV
jgi:hemerythrin superfamily protein